MRHSIFIAILCIATLLCIHGCNEEPNTESGPAVAPKTPAATPETPTPSPEKTTPKEDDGPERPGSVTLPIQETAPSTPTPSGCDPVNGPQPLEPRGFLDGRAMSQKPDDLYTPPWEKEFGRTYVGPQDMLAPGDGRLYVCSGVDEMVVLDIREPGNIKAELVLRPSTHLESLEPNKGMAVLHHRRFEGVQIPNVWGRCEHIAKEKDILYFSHRGDYFRPNGYLIAYDMSGKDPVQRGLFVDKEKSLEGFAVVGENLFVAQHKDGLAVLQHRGDTLRRISEVQGLVNAWDVAVTGSHAFVADGAGGLAVIDIRRVQKPRLVKQLPIQGVIKSIAIAADGKTAYLAAGAAGLIVVDITKPTAPSIVAEVDTPGTASKVTLSGNLLALADWNDARVYNINDPQKPILVGTKTIQNENPVSRTVSVAMTGESLYIGEWFGVYGYQVFPDKKAPDLLVRETLAHLNPVAQSDQSSLRIQIENEGNERLVISQSAITVPPHEQPTQSLELSPGESKVLEVILDAPPGIPIKEGSLLLCSNDPDESEHRVRIRGEENNKTNGKPAPEVELELLDGQPWKLSEQRGSPVLIAYFATF